MSVRRGLVLAALAGAAMGPAAAQGSAGIELGAYAAWFVPDGDVASGSGVGAGARGTLPFASRFAVDVDLGWHTAGGGDLSVFVPAAALLYGRPGASGPFVGAGFAAARLSATGAEAVTDEALVALAGYRYFLGRRTALRLDVRALVVPASDVPGVDRAMHGIVTLGVSFFPTRQDDPDSDGDGVPDGQDRCVGTPARSVVDERGCPQDSDGDGSPNGLDACPHTPAGTITTPDGCPRDEDRDGVYDGMDQCPRTPAGASVDVHGCPADGDGDGVFDGADRCPDTPAGAAVDAAGCTRDSDGDGVLDGSDRCPDTPRGAAVGDDGCPRSADTLFTDTRTAVVLRGVVFETGKARLLPQSTAVLDQVVAALLANPEWRVEVAGYTDNTGSARTNRRLSRERADAVRAYLVRGGVAGSRLVARGYGPADPVATNATEEGRARNRRVELRRLE